MSDWDTLKARLKLGFHPEGAEGQLLVLSDLGCCQACVSQRWLWQNLEVGWGQGACKQGSPCDYQGSTGGVLGQNGGCGKGSKGEAGVWVSRCSA